MRRLKRVFHAFGRYRHGHGFGVHSPFAFKFILYTLRERTPFYAYSTLASCRKKIKDSTRKRHIMSEKHMRMLFRIVNRFEPDSVLEIGSFSGEETVAIMEASSALKLKIYAPVRRLPDFIEKSYSGRIGVYDELPRTADSSFIIVADIDDSLLLQTEDLLRRTLLQPDRCDIVVVFPNIHTNGVRRLLNEVRSVMPYGMTFYNEKSFAVTVVKNKLPRQDFRVAL